MTASTTEISRYVGLYLKNVSNDIDKKALEKMSRLLGYTVYEIDSELTRLKKPERLVGDRTIRINRRSKKFYS